MPAPRNNAFLDALDQTTSHALLLNVVAAVGAASLMNGLIFSLGWNTPDDPARQPFFAPPGFVIGFVWMILFALMAGARWKLSGAVASGRAGARSSRARVTTLIVFCLAWPLYSLALGSIVGGLLGCVVALVLAVVAVARASRVSMVACALVAPVPAWLLYATAILVAQLLQA